MKGVKSRSAVLRYRVLRLIAVIIWAGGGYYREAKNIRAAYALYRLVNLFVFLLALCLVAYVAVYAAAALRKNGAGVFGSVGRGCNYLGYFAVCICFFNLYNMYLNSVARGSRRNKNRHTVIFAYSASLRGVSCYFKYNFIIFLHFLLP